MRLKKRLSTPTRQMASPPNSDGMVSKDEVNLATRPLIQETVRSALLQRGQDRPARRHQPNLHEPGFHTGGYSICISISPPESGARAPDWKSGSWASVRDRAVIHCLE